MSSKTTLVCAYCGNEFERRLAEHKYRSSKTGDSYKAFCSKACNYAYVDKKLTVSCDLCGKVFEKKQSEMRKTKGNFCTKSCAATFNNKARKERGYSLKGETKTAICSICLSACVIGLNASSDYVVCDSCRAKVVECKCSICGKVFIKQASSIKPICYECGGAKPLIENCEKCGGAIEDPTQEKRYCHLCYSEFKKEHGVKIGRISAAIQVRRSKNEVYFAELCKSKFVNVLCNEPYFDSHRGKWDADVILPNHKMAVLWNGPWHYKKITQAHNLEQVQTRDKIKLDVIAKNNFTAYVVQDMGKHNPKFVEQEFEKFMKFVEGRN